MKNILVIYYSQTGQLGQIVNNFCEPFTRDLDTQVEVVQVQPEKPFAFPWTGKGFFAVMPDSVLLNPISLKPLSFKRSSYDLIVIGYQPWFLSPSLPTTALLHNKEFTDLLKDTPVVTLIGARNMWINAQEALKEKLSEHKAKVVGNIVLIDENQNLPSVVSISYWMFSGKKERYMGIFPKPGITDRDINKAGTFGEAVREHLVTNKLEDLQKKLVEIKALKVKSNLMIIESRGHKIFKIWARIISRKKNKTLWLKIFKYYLIFALVFIAPIVLLINFLLQPFLYNKLKKQRRYYLGLK